MIKNVLLLGGSGFVGTWIANRLSQMGVRVTIPTRRRERNKANIMLPQVEVVEANINDESVLLELLRGKDAVINLVGILHDHDSQLPYGKGFGAAHAELPKKVITAMKQAGVRRLVHMSALGADVNGCSEYLRSKGEGEAAKGLEFYINDHRKHFAGLIERDYYAYGRKVLFAECEKIAEAILRSEIQIKPVK